MGVSFKHNNEHRYGCQLLQWRIWCAETFRSSNYLTIVYQLQYFGIAQLIQRSVTGYKNVVQFSVEASILLFVISPVGSGCFFVHSIVTSRHSLGKQSVIRKGRQHCSCEESVNFWVISLELEQHFSLLYFSEIFCYICQPECEIMVLY
jgi:hypothetical protein